MIGFKGMDVLLRDPTDGKILEVSSKDCQMAH